MGKEKRLACPICFVNSDVENYCIRKNCAWWESYEKECSILVLAKTAVESAQDREAGV